MDALDLTILAVYLAAVVGIGWSVGRRSRDLRDYCLSGRRAPWWAILASIVATETSTVTFLSVPAFAFAPNSRGEGGNWTFLSLALGSVLGRVLVVTLLLPRYFRGELFTVYQALEQRFDHRVRRAASAIFLATRSVADGIRLMATALVLTALTSWSDPVAIVLIGLVTVFYTCIGGMKAVIWTDLLQLVIYLGGAIAAAAMLLSQIPGGWETVLEIGHAHEKFRVFDFDPDPGRSYTFWAGLVGGAFLTTATHGTDQLMVQRYLSARNAREAARALLGSGAVILLQFTLFLTIGTMLYAWHSTGAALPEAVVERPDRVFPWFVVTGLPPGIRGLVVAAVFAAAMSTLSSSLNSLATASLTDFHRTPTAGVANHGIRAVGSARWWTVFWGLLQVGVALATARTETRVVDMALALASFTSGPVLGLFLLTLAPRRVDSSAALIGLLAGVVFMLLVGFTARISWQWYALSGAAATWAVGTVAARGRSTGNLTGPPRA